jgi:hypothetical protein
MHRTVTRHRRCRGCYRHARHDTGLAREDLLVGEDSIAGLRGTVARIRSVLVVLVGWCYVGCGIPSPELRVRSE